jgi:DNA-binding MarR family transcriptional regulator
MNPDELYTRFDGIFFEKTRLSMLTLLYKEDVVAFNRFKKILGGTDGALYSHLKKLIEADYITSRKTVAENTVATLYKLTKRGREAFQNYLAFLEGVVKKGRKEKKG